MRTKSYRNKKKIWRILAIVLLVLVLAGSVYGILVNRYNNQDHAEEMSAEDRYFMNLSITTFGQTKSQIGAKDVLIVDTVTKKFGGDTLVTFVIYQYESLTDYTRALKMTAEEMAADPAFRYVGNGEVTLRNDDIALMGNIKTSYIL